MTLKEIQEAVKANPALTKEIAVWAGSTTEGKELLTNFAKAEVDKEVKKATAELYTNIDNDLFEVLGQRKDVNQKTYDFLKKIATEYKELKAKADKLNDNEKVKELEAEIKKMKDEGSVNEHWKKIYDEASAKWETEKRELAEKLTAKEEEFLRGQIEADLKAGLPDLKMEDETMQKAVNALVDLETAKILKTAKRIDGKVVYHKEDGTPMVNKEYKPITSKEIWEDKLGSLIKTDTQTNQGGGGAKTTVKEGKVVKTGEGDNATIKLVLDKASFSTKREFNELADKALRAQGESPSSKGYKDAMLAAYKEYEVDKLDLQ